MSLKNQLEDYLHSSPDEAELVAEYMDLLHDPMAFVRERWQGHFTASAWLIDARGDRVLLTHHRKLQRWLQLGGHADGDHDLQQVALKEAEEESGLTGLTILPGIFDIDRHWIPEHKNVPGHWHYDVRYIVQAGDSDAFIVSDESNDLAWVNIDALHNITSDESLLRMQRKWNARAG